VQQEVSDAAAELSQGNQQEQEMPMIRPIRDF
jgi:hypothetical protein